MIAARRLHPAWLVLGALTVCMLAASGLRAVFGVYIKPMEAEMGWSRGALSGAAGSFLVLGDVGVFRKNITSGRGYIAFVIIILARYRPVGALVAALGFGLAQALTFYLQLKGVNIPSQFVLATPYVVTLLAKPSPSGLQTSVPATTGSNPGFFGPQAFWILAARRTSRLLGPPCRAAVCLRQRARALLRHSAPGFCWRQLKTASVQLWSRFRSWFAKRWPAARMAFWQRSTGLPRNFGSPAP